MRLSLVHWLIAAALVANAAVFFWAPSREGAQDSVPLNDLRSLKLLSELEDPPPAQLPIRDARSPVPSASPAVTAPSAGSEDKSDSDVVAVTSREQTVAALPEVEAAPEQAILAEGGAVQESTPPVSEPALESLPEPVPQPVQAPEPVRCWLAGPVESDVLSEQLAAQFAAAGTGMDLVLRTVEVSPDHWVYLPTDGSQSEVRRLSRELRQSGYDNFQITDGPLAGSLSLGLFRSEERAVALRDMLRARGHAVEIFPRPAYREQPWAAVDDAARVALGWPDLPGPVPGFAALELVNRSCPAADDR